MSDVLSADEIGAILAGLCEEPDYPEMDKDRQEREKQKEAYEMFQLACQKAEEKDYVPEIETRARKFIRQAAENGRFFTDIYLNDSIEEQEWQERARKHLYRDGYKITKIDWKHYRVSWGEEKQDGSFKF